MGALLVFLAIIMVSAAAAKLGVGTDRGVSFLFDIPRNMSAARATGWVRSHRPPGPLPQLVMYCYRDKVFCIFFDDTGYIAGVQVAVATLEVSENVFDWTKLGFTCWTTLVDGACKKFWTLQQYFVDEKYLSMSAAERLASRDPTRLLQAGGVWLARTERQLLKASNQEIDIVVEGLFTKQACIDSMGLHYYYNMSSATKCTADQMYSWFLLTKNCELIGTAFVIFGQVKIIEGARDWFERPTQQQVEAIVPYGPECIYSMADNPGALTMHIFYVDKPWTITC